MHLQQPLQITLGVPTLDDTTEVQIKGGEFFAGEAFVADGEEIQLNDKRYGIGVVYNRDTKTFTLKVVPLVKR